MATVRIARSRRPEHSLPQLRASNSSNPETLIFESHCDVEGSRRIFAQIRAVLRSARSADFPLDLDLFPGWRSPESTNKIAQLAVLRAMPARARMGRQITADPDGNRWIGLIVSHSGTEVREIQHSCRAFDLLAAACCRCCALRTSTCMTRTCLPLFECHGHGGGALFAKGLSCSPDFVRFLAACSCTLLCPARSSDEFDCYRDYVFCQRCRRLSPLRHGCPVLRRPLSRQKQAQFRGTGAAGPGGAVGEPGQLQGQGRR